MKHKIFKFFAIIIILMTIIFVYASYINPLMFKVNEIGIYHELLPSDYNGLKILHFSDLDYPSIKEEYLAKVITEINKTNPDLVIFTGDMFTKKPNKDEINLLKKYLTKINAKLFKLACIGDNDLKYLNIYEEILTDSGFELLNNANKLIYADSTTPINIIGLSDNSKINELYNNEYFTITIMHKPDLIKDISTNLAFAGHSLGGTLRLPFVDGLIKRDGATTYYQKNFYQVHDAKLYISNGIGTYKYNYRLFNTPSITLYRLYQN